MRAGVLLYCGDNLEVSNLFIHRDFMCYRGIDVMITVQGARGICEQSFHSSCAHTGGYRDRVYIV